MEDLKNILKNLRQHLMTGVSYMIPFVVAGGILLSLSVVLNGEAGVPQSGWKKDLFFIGVAGFKLMIPILAAYIGFSIADKPAIAPCAIAAWVGNEMGTGFIGALVAGVLGGIVVFYLKKIPVPKVFRSIMPIFVIPIVGTLITAGFMQWVIGAPIANMTIGLTNWLNSMRGANIILLAIIIGSMEAFDMGGPINKVAYAFVILCVSQNIINIPGISAVCVATPPIGMGLATLINKKAFSEEDRDAGIAGILMGSVGITEGAIPFAAKNPLKVIPSLMIGTSVAGAIAAALGVTCKVAWGGLIVLPLVGNKLGFIIALLAGSLTIALLVNFLKIGESEENKDEDVELDISF